MKKLDLTPLIDILFILLFAILINGNTQFEERIEAEKNAADVAIAALSESPVQLSFDERTVLDALGSHVRVVRTELRGHDNRLYIDGEPTALFIAEPVDTYNVYRHQLQSELSRASEGRTESLVLFIAREDGRVYRYAWLALLSALREKTAALGTDRALYTVQDCDPTMIPQEAP